MTATAAVVVLCTAPPSSGRELAQQLVEERLCACVNVLPAVLSCFRWEGRVESAEEMLLVVKTTAAAAPKLRARIVELHPYDVPEVLELPVAGGLPAYLQWLGDAVAP
ncbi:MAG: divalent-cation tolerance protein CutA [Planctomycetes bacterium]|nr:divalent-cation tolerance protein CutA [Planctomycetota bacterium]